MNRFSFNEEFSLQRGYRRVKAMYRRISRCHRAKAGSASVPRCIEALSLFGKAHGMQVRPDQAERFSDLELMNLLGVSLPFHPAEKQALLEAPTLKDREKMLIDLLRLGAGPVDAMTKCTPRTLN